MSRFLADKMLKTESRIRICCGTRSLLTMIGVIMPERMVS